MKALPTLLLALCIGAALPTGAQTTARFDVLITEIMADPVPVVGLPNAEWVEIRNRSPISINLLGWKLSNTSTTATINTPIILLSDSALILCATSQVVAFAAFGKAVGIPSFPSLGNDNDLITLRSPQNRVIHAVSYNSDWYGNDVKKEGGWSLEMIDVRNPCGSRTNWKASIHPQGGTPGRPNSVAAVNPDVDPPLLLKGYAKDSKTVDIVFNEPLDSSTAALPANYTLNGNFVIEALPLAPLYETVQLKLNTPLHIQQVYTVTVDGVSDCAGNSITGFNQAKIGLFEGAVKNDLVINEILFNPRPGEYDYIELYNRGNKIVDAATLLIANRTQNNGLSSIRKLSVVPLPIYPGDYIVVTENKTSLTKAYFAKTPGAVVELPSLPSLPDDKGNIVLVNTTGDAIDEVAYNKDWHFALIDNQEGVALERISPEAPSQQQASWHSAAATVGYGTPTYQNSQQQQSEPFKATLTVSPAVFSPDNDGRDDFALLSYQLETTGYVANVLILDAAGRLVRNLVKNDLLATRGFWTWDGLGEQQQKLPVGTYILLTEIFNLQGKRKSFKQTIVLSRPLR